MKDIFSLVWICYIENNFAGIQLYSALYSSFKFDEMSLNLPKNILEKCYSLTACSPTGRGN